MSVSAPRVFPRCSNRVENHGLTQTVHPKMRLSQPSRNARPVRLATHWRASSIVIRNESLWLRFQVMGHISSPGVYKLSDMRTGQKRCQMSTARFAVVEVQKTSPFVMVLTGPLVSKTIRTERIRITAAERHHRAV